MITTSMQLLENMNTRLAAISGADEDDIQSIQESILVVSEALAHLRSIILSGNFRSPSDEIQFFKKIKPQFDGRLIFYLILLRLQATQVSFAPDDRHRVYIRELEQLTPFYDHHYSFWQYYRMDQTYLDEHYFLRRNNDTVPALDEDKIHYDWQTNTLMSIVVAKIYAYDLLREHLSLAMTRLSISLEKTDKGNKTSLSWTSSKTALIELIYALHEYGVFNNGQTDIKKIADHFSFVFQIHFANVYKSYEDIRLRKKNPTPFLDALKSALERRIDRDNENAM